MLHRPFQDADWIWYGTHNVDIVNAFMQARRIFRLKKIPGRAELCVTADARYALYVNGRFVTRGPARGFQKSWPFDRVNVAPYLRKGNNVLAALVHSLGISNFQYLHQGWAGFILAGRAGGMNLATGPDWKVRQAPGYRRVLTRLSAQLGFQEFFDAWLDDGSWTKPAFDDADWRAPSCYPSGQLPWPAFEERGMPLLRERIVLPDSVVLTARGKTGRKWKTSENVVKTFCSETWNWRTSRLQLRRQSEWSVLKVARADGGRENAFCVDMGHEVLGCVRMGVDVARGGEILDVIACEALCEGKPNTVHSDFDGDCVAMGSRLILKPGLNEHEFFAPWGFRYLVIIPRNIRRTFDLKLAVKQAGYPLDGYDAFKCSDDRLNQVYDICFRSLQCCMLDAFLDCPHREQAQWLHDARIQALTSYPLTGNALLLRRAIRQVGALTDEDGLIFALAPAIGFNHIMPDYNLIWVMSHWDYYRQTGDLTLFHEMEPRIQGIMGFFEKRVSTLGVLLWPQERKYWMLLPCRPLFPQGEQPGYSTLFNLFYLGALQAVANLYQAARRLDRAQSYRRRAERLRECIVHRLYDQVHGRLYGGLTLKGKPVESVRMRGKAVQGDPCSAGWAILLNVLPDRNPEFGRQVMELIDDESLGYPLPQIWFMAYLLEALEKTGHQTEVFDCLRRWWWQYLVKAKGLTTTPEHWHVNGMGWGSRCHAWGAHPILSLFRIGVGIWQTGIACKAVRFAPDFTQLEWARGSMTTPLGKVHAAWAKTPTGINIRVKAPRDMAVQIELPGYKKTHRGPFSLKLRLPNHQPGRSIPVKPDGIVGRFGVGQAG